MKKKPQAAARAVIAKVTMAPIAPAWASVNFGLASHIGVVMDEANVEFGAMPRCEQNPAVVLQRAHHTEAVWMERATSSDLKSVQGKVVSFRPNKGSWVRVPSVPFLKRKRTRRSLVLEGKVVIFVSV